jgi:hypothetical protein
MHEISTVATIVAGIFVKSMIFAPDHTHPLQC